MITPMTQPRTTDDLLARIDAAIADATRGARLDDPAAQKMLDAMTALMAQGERSLQPRQVGGHAGFPPAVARRVFKDRSALLHAYRQRDTLMHLEAMKAALRGADRVDRVVRAIQMFGGIFGQPMGISVGRRTLENWAEACSSGELRAEYVRTQELWTAIIEHLVEDEIGEGALPFTPPNVAALLSVCLDGMIVTSTLQPERRERERAISTGLALWELVKQHCAAGTSGPVDEERHGGIR